MSATENMTADQITAFIKANPGSTVAEIGCKPSQLLPLVEAGTIYKSGHRSTGKQGRPPVEYTITGVDAPVALKPVIQRAKPDDEPDASLYVLDPESARVVAYCDQELARMRAGERIDPDTGKIDQTDYRNMRDVRKERLRRGKLKSALAAEQAEVEEAIAA